MKNRRTSGLVGLALLLTLCGPCMGADEKAEFNWAGGRTAPGSITDELKFETSFLNDTTESARVSFADDYKKWFGDSTIRKCDRVQILLVDRFRRLGGSISECVPFVPFSERLKFVSEWWHKTSGKQSGESWNVEALRYAMLLNHKDTVLMLCKQTMTASADSELKFINYLMSEHNSYAAEVNVIENKMESLKH